MQRRDVLLSAVTAGALAASGAAAAPAATAKAKPRTQAIRTRDGLQLFHREWGEGQPVLFVHSWGLSSNIWTYQTAFLGDQGLRCIAFDRRGHGRSDPSDRFDMDTLADDLSSVIEGLNLQNVILVGHSMGCAEILHYVGRHGTNRIAKIAMLAPFTPFLTQTEDNALGLG